MLLEKPSVEVMCDLELGESLEWTYISFDNLSSAERGPNRI